MAMACQLSYPRNSENARPPGTLSVYLSCAEIAVPIPNAASAITTLAPISRFLPFIATSVFGMNKDLAAAEPLKVGGTTPAAERGVDCPKVLWRSRGAGACRCFPAQGLSVRQGLAPSR